jgi:broad specificity phosphatase PhoE
MTSASSQPPGEVVLLRHGATEWSTEGKHTGRTDVALSADGEQQAEAVKPALATRNFAQVLSSPLVRALRTAELAGLHNIEIDPNLQEWDYGRYEGLTTADICERQPGWSLWREGVRGDEAVDDGPGAEQPGAGESVADVGARADAVIARVVPTLEAGDVLLVSHGHYLRVLAARWLGLPPTDGGLLALDTASLSVLGFEHGNRVVRHWNQLPGEGPAAD